MRLHHIFALTLITAVTGCPVSSPNDGLGEEGEGEGEEGGGEGVEAECEGEEGEGEGEPAKGEGEGEPAEGEGEGEPAEGEGEGEPAEGEGEEEGGLRTLRAFVVDPVGTTLTIVVTADCSLTQVSYDGIDPALVDVSQRTSSEVVLAIDMQSAAVRQQVLRRDGLDVVAHLSLRAACDGEAPSLIDVGAAPFFPLIRRGTQAGTVAQTNGAGDVALVDGQRLVVVNAGGAVVERTFTSTVSGVIDLGPDHAAWGGAAWFLTSPGIFVDEALQDVGAPLALTTPSGAIGRRLVAPGAFVHHVQHDGDTPTVGVFEQRADGTTIELTVVGRRSSFAVYGPGLYAVLLIRVGATAPIVALFDTATRTVRETALAPVRVRDELAFDDFVVLLRPARDGALLFGHAGPDSHFLSYYRASATRNTQGVLRFGPAVHLDTIDYDFGREGAQQPDGRFLVINPDGRFGEIRALVCRTMQTLGHGPGDGAGGGFERMDWRGGGFSTVDEPVLPSRCTAFTREGVVAVNTPCHTSGATGVRTMSAGGITTISDYPTIDELVHLATL